MKTNRNKSIIIMKSTLSRLPLYYCFLKEKINEGEQYISSSVIAESLKLNAILVRKDLAGVCSVPGKPRLGFEIEKLMIDIEEHLGYNNVNESVLIGVGRLGRTLLSYEGFMNYGLNIVAGFDVDEDLIGLKIGGKPILSMSKLESMIERLNIRTAIIAVSKEHAQAISDKLVSFGIKAIWNFAPTHIDLPEGVIIKNENLAASLAALTKELSKNL